MENVQNIPTQEELDAERAATAEAEAKEDEIRTGVIEEFGFDPETDKERIDKMVNKEVAQRKKLSTAVGQKIKHRTDAQAKETELAQFRQGKKPPVSKKDNKPELSSTDVYVLIQGKVPQEDISEVQDFATLKGITIADALKSPIVQGILSSRAEERAVAAATNTGTRPATKTAPTDESVLADASKGKLPDDPETVASARMNSKKAKK